MPRQLSINSRQYTPGTYGPFVIDGRQLGDKGARIEITRDNDGTWPLTATDAVLSVTIEGLYGAEWLMLGGATFNGGSQQFRGATKLAEYINIEWPKELVGGVLTPNPPDACRFTAQVLETLRAGIAVTWL